MSIYAKTPTGTLWFLYASDEVPTLTPIQHPSIGLIRDTLYESPTFFSMPGRTIARQWVVNEAGSFTLKTVPLNQGTVEYIEFVTPAGISWAIGLNDNGTLFTELFTSSVPKTRRLITTVLHKGRHVFVADNRFPPPRIGGY